MIETDIEATDRESQDETDIADGLTAIGASAGPVTLRPLGAKRAIAGRKRTSRGPWWDELL